MSNETTPKRRGRPPSITPELVAAVNNGTLTIEEVAKRCHIKPVSAKAYVWRMNRKRAAAAPATEPAPPAATSSTEPDDGTQIIGTN